MKLTRFACLTSAVAALMIVVSGCGSGNTPKGAKDGKGVAKGGKKDWKDDDHGHPHDGPHGGPLVEWGEEEFHVEFTRDKAKQETRAYVLGPDARKYVPIKAAKLVLSVKDPSFQIELTPEPQNGEPSGSSSVYVGKHEKVGVDQRLSGSISAEFNGKPYSGPFKEHDHKGEKKK